MIDKISGATDAGAAHLHRLVLFSDAVFAIAITLLAIEIHPPEHWQGIAQLLSLMSAKLIAYAVSFAVIGISWVSHRRVYARIVRADDALDILNLLVLGVIGLLPLGTELLWEQHGQALLIYVSLVAAMGVSLGLLWAYAAFVGKLTEPMSKAEAVFVLVRVALLPGLMCVLTFLSMAKPVFALLFIPLIGGLSWMGRRLRDRASASDAFKKSCRLMRIVSGQYRGKAIVTPPGDTTRPTSDRARQAVFNILEHAAWAPDLHGARVVDVFAGSGALGLEALSRGAGFCLFVETDDAARGAIRENIDAMHLFGVTRVHRRDATDLGPRPSSAGAPFDLAFLDPPYAKGLGEKAVVELREHGWLAPGAILMFERGRGEVDPTFEGFELLDARDYGAARVLFFKLS